MLQSSKFRRRPSQSREDGYALLILLLTLALMAIMAAVVVPSLEFQIKHDREEELVHRGVQYSRAIRAYYRKFGRYPAKIEDLENTNQMRFLRKRYKDPITGEDFKLLHFGEVKMYGSLIPPVQNPLNNANPFGAQNNTGGLNGGNAAKTPATTTKGSDAKAGNTDNPDASDGSDSSDSSQSKSESNDPLSGQTFGGGPIVGVVSISKKEGYREFNKKKKYSEWQFVFDPATGAGLITGPNQLPPIQEIGEQPTAPPLQNDPSRGTGGAPGAPVTNPQNPNSQPTSNPDTPSNPNQQQ